MGTRLYPNTQDVAALEMLCGVAAGTAARRAAVELRHAGELAAATPAERSELEYAQWEEVNNDPDLGTYAAFLLYGWGKFDGRGIAEGYAGSLTDLDAVARLFTRNGIPLDVDLALTEGVHWC